MADDVPEDRADELGSVRARIEAIDAEILALLGERFRHVRWLGRFKERAHLPVENPEREAELRALYLRQAEAEGLDPDLVLRLFEGILARSKVEQSAQGRRPRTA